MNLFQGSAYFENFFSRVGKFSRINRVNLHAQECAYFQG